MPDYIWSLEDSAGASGARPAVVSPWGTCTFAELAQMVRALSIEFSRDGRHRRVLSAPPGPAQFAALLACRRTSVIGLPVLPTASRSRLATADAWAASPETDTRSPAGGIAYFSSGTSTGRSSIHVDRSGSRHRGRTAVFDRYAAGAEHGPHLMALPLYHAGILRPALYALEAGSTVVVLKEWSSQILSRIATRTSAASVFLPPGLLFDLAASFTPSMRVPARVMFGGDYVPHWMRLLVADRFGERLLGFYGTSRGAISEYGVEDLLEPLSVGKPHPYLKAAVEAAQDERTGRVKIGRLSGNGEVSWEDTGDVGYFGDDGRLMLMGRERYVDDVSTLSTWRRFIETPGTLGASVQRADDRWVFDIEFDSRFGRRSTLTDAAEEGSLRPYELRVHQRGALPRTDSGKVFVDARGAF